MLNGLNARHIQHKCWLWVSCVCTCTCMYIIQRAPRFTDTEAALKIAQEEECSKQPQQQTAEYGDETVKKRDDAQHTEEEGTEKAKGRKRKAKPLESNVLYFYILPASLHVSVCCLVCLFIHRRERIGLPMLLIILSSKFHPCHRRDGSHLRHQGGSHPCHRNGSHLYNLRGSHPHQYW